MICMDGAQDESEVSAKKGGSVGSVVNFFVSPIKFMKSKGVNIAKLASVNDVKSLIKEIQPAMSPEIAKATGELLGLANVMGVDLTSANPLFGEIRSALAEGIKGYMQTKGGNDELQG